MLKRKDFSWEGRNINPYLRGNKNSKSSLLVLRPVLLLGIVCLTLFLLFHHPYFRIESIRIAGTQRIDAAELELTIRGIMDKKKFFFLEGDNFFLVNLGEINAILMERFPIRKLALTKTFPNNMSLRLDEKISTLIYDNTQQYAYVDSGGSLIEVLKNVEDTEWISVKSDFASTVSSTDNQAQEVSSTAEILIQKIHKPKVKDIWEEFGHYPVLVERQKVTLQKGEQKLPSEIAGSVISLFDLFNKKTKIPVDFFEFDSANEQLIIRTGEGWYVLFDSSRSFEDQFDTLLSVLDNDAFGNSKIDYIDLRFEGRIYWK